MPTQSPPAPKRVVVRTTLSLAIGFLFAVAALRLSAASPAPAGYALISPAARVAAPGFTLTGIDGRKLTLAQFRGHVVLLDFWAVDCGGCKIEIPWYVAFDRAWHARGLQLIGIDMYGEKPALIRPFMAKTGMTYPVAVGTDAIGARFHVDELPLTLLIDRQGRIALSHSGVVDRPAFESALEQLLR